MTYDGDPKLYNSGDGADISIVAGQPIMDEGLENAVELSLFTSPGWWGNSVSEPDEQYGSELGDVMRRTLTNQTRLDAAARARTALAWLVSSGVAKSVSVTASIPQVGMLGLVISIEQPDRTTTIRYQVNWSEMSFRVLGAA